jgi:hypothetical protein
MVRLKTNAEVAVNGVLGMHVPRLVVDLNVEDDRDGVNSKD